MRRLVLFAASLLLSPGFAHGQGQIQWGTDPNQPQGAFGRPTQQPTAPAPSVGAVKPPAQATAEPSWPQRFEVGAGERSGFGFVVGQPGRIVVTVQSQGAPLIISLVKPGGDTVDKQGTGSTAIEYNATADDVKRGVVWTISMRPAQGQKPAGISSAALHDKPLKVELKPVASGTVNVVHPTADVKRAETEANAHLQKAQTQDAMARQRSTPSSVERAAQKQSAEASTRSARHAALLEQSRGKIPAVAFERMSQQIQGTTSGTKTAPFSTTSQADTGTGTSGAPSTGGASPVGGNQPASVAAGPAITGMSVSQGDPGTPVLITGSGFSNVQGEVHFIVGNGRDLVAQVTHWNDTQIATSVPEVSGVQEYSGQVYVKRGTQASRLVAFKFIPATDYATLGLGTDRVIATPYDMDNLLHSFVYRMTGLLLGAKADDEFNRNVTLKNGWTVESVKLVNYYGQDGVYIVNGMGAGDAYIVESRVGSASPYVKVHWWVDPGFNAVGYRPQITIQGPKGVPFQ